MSMDAMETSSTPEPQWFWGVSPWLWPVLMVAFLAAATNFPRRRANKDAQVKAAKTQLQSFREALDLYARDNGTLPSTKQGLGALLHRPWRSPRADGWAGPYLANTTAIPKDPWGNPFVYRPLLSLPERYLLLSYGADGKPGGTNHDQDLLVTGDPETP